MSAKASSILVSFLGFPKNGSYHLSNGQLDFNCPYCRDENHGQWDGKYNLGITFPGARGRPPLVAACWKCGYAETTRRFVRAYGQPEHYRQWVEYEDSLPLSVRRAAPRPTREAELPEDFERVRERSQDPAHIAAWDYLTRVRGVPGPRVEQLGFGVSADPRWVNRVLLPGHDADGRLNFLIGRLLWDNDPKNPPYNTTYGVKRTEIIFNEHLVDWNQPVTVVEGIFDYAAYPHNTVLLLGKSLGPGSPLEQRLRHYRPAVVVAVDMDAVEAKQKARTAKTDHQDPASVNALRVRAAADREAVLQRLADLGLSRRYYLDLPYNDLGQALQEVGAQGAARVYRESVRPDRERTLESW